MKILQLNFFALFIFLATSCSEKELIETENASQSTKVQTNYSSLRETGNEENDKEMI